MSWDYIKDGFNPRGAEYGASARAARAARKTQEGMDDMLTLAMQPNERARMAAAYEISQRRKREAARESRSYVAQLVMCAMFILFCVGVYQLGDDNSAVSHAYNAVMASGGSQGADNASAPVRAVRAPQ